MSVTLGSVRANIADTIANQQQEIQKAPTKSDLEKAIEAATSWLTNGKGYAYFRKDDLGNIVDILFMDTQDVETAVNVMRVGQSGIGFSHNGVNGPYQSAWTIDGNFVADFITTGNLSANLIKSGTITSQDGSVKFDLVSNKIEIGEGTGPRPNWDSKLVLDAFGVSGYGKNEVTNQFEKTINILPGTRRTEGQYIFSGITSLAGIGLSIFTDGGTLSLGDLRADTIIYGSPIKINNKEISWKDNGDGTFTLIGE